MKRHSLTFVLALLAMVASACSLDEATPPPLAGPSEFALGIVLQATPDSILQDGISQSVITIDAKGPDGRPARGVAVRLMMSANGEVVDFGTLSTKTTTTGDDGRARVTYTAPPRPSDPTDVGTLVTIEATPIGSDFRAEHARQVDIRVIPPGIIQPRNNLVAAFTFAPASPTAFTAVTFDASTTTNQNVACADRCTYSWTFGDGGSGIGMVAQHEFRAVGPFVVQLTATNAQGQSTSVTRTVTVGGGEMPTAAFTFSPSAPLPGQAIFFNASASTATAGRRIVRYDWDFGSGRTGEGVTVSKTYDTAASYTVSLRVTDDANQVGTTTQTVTVGGGSATVPTASFVFSPETPRAGDMIFFNASASTAGPGRRIVSYRWDFGSGRTGEGVTISKGYDTAASYVVTLLVTDDQGQQGTTSQTVEVIGQGASSELRAFFDALPNPAARAQNVTFDASGSTAASGKQIVSYTWDMDDNGATRSGQSVVYSFGTAKTYNVVLTVRDNAGAVSIANRLVVVQ